MDKPSFEMALNSLLEVTIRFTLKSVLTLAKEFIANINYSLI